MSHASNIARLTGELIQASNNPSPSRDARVHKASKDAILRELRHHKFGRVNQFNVQNSLEGLVEKFHVLDKDDNGNALDSLLKQLYPRKYRWTPEVLALFLHLSDRPAEKSYAADFADKPEKAASAVLTWDEVLANDPSLAVEGSWGSIDYAEASSDEDTTSLSQGESDGEESAATSDLLDDVDEVLAAEIFLLTVDQSLLEPIQDQHARRQHNGESILVEEVQVLREALHMLLGLPAVMFDYDADEEVILPNDRYLIQDCSETALRSTLKTLANIGSDVLALRAFAQKSQQSTLLQRLSAVLSRQLQSFDEYLLRLEHRYIAVSVPQTVSILSLTAEIEAQLDRHVAVSRDLIAKCENLDIDDSYRVLDELYGAASEAEMNANETRAKALTRMLLECLEAYMRPARTWISTGALPMDERDFFIRAKPSENLETFWADRYELRYGDEGSPLAPAFLWDFTEDILDSGKGVAFLQQITGVQNTHSHKKLSEESNLFSYEEVFGQSSLIAIIPLGVTLNIHLQKWLQETHNNTWPRLHNALFSKNPSSSLTTTLDTLSALHYSPFLTDLGTAIFARLDAQDPHWAHPVALTHLARAIATAEENSSTISQQTVSAITASVQPNASTSTKSTSASKTPQRSVRALSQISLHFAYPAHLANVIPRTRASAAYGAVTTLLLQLQRATSLLAAHYPLFRPVNASAHLATQERSLRLRWTLLHTLGCVKAHVTHQLSASETRLWKGLEDATSMSDLIRLVDGHLEALEVVGLANLHNDKVRMARDAIVGIADLSVLFADAVTATATSDIARENAFDAKVQAMWRQTYELRGVLVVALRSVHTTTTAAGGGAQQGLEGMVGWEELAEELVG